MNFVYLTPGLLPAKYLTPGILFLLVFQVFLIVYTVYISLTNFGSGHNSSKDDAVNALLLQSQVRVEDSPAYPVKILEQSGGFYFLVDGSPMVRLCSAAPSSRSTEVDDAQMEGDQAVGVDGYTTLDFGGDPRESDARSRRWRFRSRTTPTTASFARPTDRRRTSSSRASSGTRSPIR